ncbi:MAG: hypothetical protein H6706_11105 [Myxococcales bacterium]|nr:hypothetical protein [Myxococcales bacterium]
MDAATRVQIAGLIYTAVLPTAAVAVTSLVGRRLRPSAAQSGVLLGVAVLAGALTAWLGIAGLPDLSDAKHQAVLAGLLAAALGLALDVLPPLRGRTVAVAIVGALALAFGLWRTSAPLQGIWKDGVAVALASQAWVLDAGVIGLVAWLLVDHAARRVSTPAALGPLALACAGAAGVSVLSHSALVGQLFGGLGLATGVAALLGWWKPDLRPGHGVVAVVMAMFTTLLVYAHLSTDSPRVASTLLLLAPTLGISALLGKRTLVGVLIAGALTAIPVAAAVKLTHARFADDAPADGGGSTEPDYGSLGNY